MRAIGGGGEGCAGDLTPVSFFAGEQSSLKNRLSRILYGYEQRYRYIEKTA